MLFFTKSLKNQHVGIDSPPRIVSTIPAIPGSVNVALNAAKIPKNQRATFMNTANVATTLRPNSNS